MFQINFLIITISALVPTLVGMVWYNPKVLGTIWMNEIGKTEESLKGGNMPVIFGVSLFLSFFLAMGLHFIVIHQFGLFSMLQHATGLFNDDKTLNLTHPAAAHVQYLMDNYGNEFRSFKHGALHGFLTSTFIALPIIATGAMFERRSFKYIGLTWGYWAITMMIMGALICHFK